MDPAVDLVQAYLRVNGYFTVTEYPVTVPFPGGGYRAATDLDILALRFPHADGAGEMQMVPDSALSAPASRPDMLIGEVKQGRAELNAGASRPDVLTAVLRRFGCCDENSAPEVVQHLQRRGHATLPNGHPVRLAAFGSVAGEGGPYLRVTIGHILGLLQGYLRENWEALHVAESRDPALGFLMLLEKAGHARSRI